MMRNTFLTFLLLLVTSLPCYAGEGSAANDTLKRPVIGYYNIEIGSRKAIATYLSPFSYQGNGFGVSGYWTKMLPVNPEHLAMNFDVRGNLGNLLNKARNAREIEIDGFFSWGMEWKKRLPYNFIIGAGGNVGLYGGVLYLPRNGNNPVSAQFATGIGITASAGWHTVIGKLPVLVTDRLTMPLMSGFFMPGYGETYYEIYLGNRNGLAHFGWFGNRVGIDNLLGVTLDFGRTSMQVGYRFTMQNAQANNLVTRIYGHSLVIGVVPGGVGLKKNRKDIITPLY